MKTDLFHLLRSAMPSGTQGRFKGVKRAGNELTKGRRFIPTCIKCTLI